MAKEKKRPSKNAKAAQKAVAASKLLAAKSVHEAITGNEVGSTVVSPRTSKAIKPRPHKKRG